MFGWTLCWTLGEAPGFPCQICIHWANVPPPFLQVASAALHDGLVPVDSGDFQPGGEKVMPRWEPFWLPREEELGSSSRGKRLPTFILGVSISTESKQGCPPRAVAGCPGGRAAAAAQEGWPELDARTASGPGDAVPGGSGSPGPGEFQNSLLPPPEAREAPSYILCLCLLHSSNNLRH